MKYTIQEYLAHVKWSLKPGHPIIHFDEYEGLAYGFLDFETEIGETLSGLAWVLSHPQSGYCSRGDLLGLVECIEVHMAKNG